MITYATLNRLATAYSNANSGGDWWGQSFSYDRYANLTGIASTKCSSPTMSVTVNAKNQVTNSGFTYNGGGNLTADGTYTYAWDGENRLASTNGVTYTYDGDGKRVKKSSGTLYWYDAGGNVIEETDLNGNLVNDYIYGAGMRLARRSASGLILTYFTDPLGSSRYVQGAGGLTHAESDYYPFGGERVISNTLASANNYKFTGMERDTESGLDHTLYRQFTSTYGRWMSPDPMTGDITNPQSLSRYTYVLDNPATLADPDGLSPLCDKNPDAPACNHDPRAAGVTDIAALAMTCLEAGLISTPFGCGGDPTVINDPEMGGIPGLPQSGSSGPLSGDYGTNLPPLGSTGSGLPCDFGNCGGPGLGFQAGEEVLGGIGLWELIKDAIFWGGFVLANRQAQPTSGCPECVPAVGTLGYRLDVVAPGGRGHFPYPGTHWHLYVRMQNPKNCQCWWSFLRVGDGPPPAGAIRIP